MSRCLSGRASTMTLTTRPEHAATDHRHCGAVTEPFHIRTAIRAVPAGLTQRKGRATDRRPPDHALVLSRHDDHGINDRLRLGDCFWRSRLHVVHLYDDG